MNSNSCRDPLIGRCLITLIMGPELLLQVMTSVMSQLFDWRNRPRKGTSKRMHHKSVRSNYGNTDRTSLFSTILVIIRDVGWYWRNQCVVHGLQEEHSRTRKTTSWIKKIYYWSTLLSGSIKCIFELRLIIYLTTDFSPFRSFAKMLLMTTSGNGCHFLFTLTIITESVTALNSPVFARPSIVRLGPKWTLETSLSSGK